MTTLATAARDVLVPHSQRPTLVDIPAPEQRTKVEPKPAAVCVPNVTREIVVKIASEPDEWEQALRLVASQYQKKGYEPPDRDLLRFTPFQALPDTMTFVAKDDSGVIGTVTLVPDNTLLGLPMDSLYGPEMAQLRRDGRRLAESISLAIGSLPLRESLHVLQALLRLKMQYHCRQGGDTWVMTVNPRHRNYYTKIMGYVPLGECREYDAVQGAPAEAFWLNLEQMANNVPRTYADFFGSDLPLEALRPCKMPAHLIRSFSSRSSRTDLHSVANIREYVDHFGSPRSW
jgi:hypothetical protein